MCYSLPEWRSLHLYPAPTRGGQVRLRVSRRALVARPDPRDYPSLRHLHALESERRVASECRGRSIMAREHSRV